MKQILGLDTGTVTFTPGAAGAGTVVVSGVYGFSAARLVAITNVTRKTLIYAAEVSGKGGAWSSLTSTGGTLTLDVSTSGHSASDVVRCVYEGPQLQSVDGLIRPTGSGKLRIACWGDSMTESTLGYVPYLRQLLGGEAEIYDGGVSGEHLGQIRDRFLADTSHRDDDVIVIWGGRNRYLAPDTNVADIKTMVQNMNHGRFLVVSVLPTTTEYAVSSNYRDIQNQNMQNQALYLGKYLDLQPLLTDASGSNLTPSYSVDGTHLRPVGNGIVAASLANKIRSLYKGQAFLEVGRFDYHDTTLNLIHGSVLNTTSYAVDMRGIENLCISLIIVSATTPAYYTLEVSFDAGATYFPYGTPVQAVVGGSTLFNVPASLNAHMARVKVSTVAVSQTGSRMQFSGTRKLRLH